MRRLFNNFFGGCDIFFYAFGGFGRRDGNILAGDRFGEQKPCGRDFRHHLAHACGADIGRLFHYGLCGVFFRLLRRGFGGGSAAGNLLRGNALALYLLRLRLCRAFGCFFKRVAGKELFFGQTERRLVFGKLSRKFGRVGKPADRAHVTDETYF